MWVLNSTDKTLVYQEGSEYLTITDTLSCGHVTWTLMLCSYITNVQCFKELIMGHELVVAEGTRWKLQWAEFFWPLWMCLFTPTSRALIKKLGQWGEMLSWICIRPVLCSDWGVLGFALLPNDHSSCSLSFSHFLLVRTHSPPLFSRFHSVLFTTLSHSPFHSLHLYGLVKARKRPVIHRPLSLLSPWW